MQNLKSLDNAELWDKTKTLAMEERRLSVEILWHLREIERRQLFAERGYPSLFDYCVDALGYSAGAAARRIRSMQLLRDMPEEVSKSLESGSVSLTTASALQNFIRADERLKKKRYSMQQKKDLLDQIQGKSRQECEKLFLSISPEAAPPKEHERLISENLVEIRFVADKELLDKLERIRELTPHRSSDRSYLDLFKYLADSVLKKIDPETRKPLSPEEPKDPDSDQPESAPRWIPASVKRYVWDRDGGRCTYQDPESGRRCDTRFGIEIDHILPIALGGRSNARNLRLLCRTHNRLAAIQALGRGVVEKFCPAL